MSIRTEAGIYAALALASLMVAGLWRALSVPATTPQTFPIAFYQNVIGQLDGKSCPSYPVCSLYARQALTRHGVVLGSWLAIDRIIHEAGDAKKGGIWMFDEGKMRLYDPLQRNDFWLRRGEK